MNKSLLRKKLLGLRASVTDRAGKDEAVFIKAKELAESEERVFVYVSIGSEVSTLRLIECLSSECAVFVPYTNESGGMRAVPLRNTSDIYRADKHGNTVGYSGESGDGKCGLIFVPLLGFDAANYRVGYGAGCYDRYFAKYPYGLKVGLAYDEQFCEFDRDSTDVPLDIIITPTKTLRRLQ